MYAIIIFVPSNIQPQVITLQNVEMFKGWIFMQGTETKEHCNIFFRALIHIIGLTSRFLHEFCWTQINVLVFLNFSLDHSALLIQSPDNACEYLLLLIMN